MSESCTAIVWKIGPFVDGELAPAERDEVETHLASCKDCVAMAMEFRQLDEKAAIDKVPPVSGDEWANVWEGILAGSEVAAGKVIRAAVAASRVRRWMLPALAAAALFLGGVFVGSSFLERPGHAPEIVKQPPPSGERKTDDFAEKRSGPEPDIKVEDDVIIIQYPNF